jgi:hypothetical protein
MKSMYMVLKFSSKHKCQCGALPLKKLKEKYALHGKSYLCIPFLGIARPQSRKLYIGSTIESILYFITIDYVSLQHRE